MFSDCSRLLLRGGETSQGRGGKKPGNPRSWIFLPLVVGKDPYASRLFLFPGGLLGRCLVAAAEKAFLDHDLGPDALCWGIVDCSPGCGLGTWAAGNSSEAVAVAEREVREQVGVRVCEAGTH